MPGIIGPLFSKSLQNARIFIPISRVSWISCFLYVPCTALNPFATETECSTTFRQLGSKIAFCSISSRLITPPCRSRSCDSLGSSSYWFSTPSIAWIRSRYCSYIGLCWWSSMWETPSRVEASGLECARSFVVTGIILAVIRSYSLSMNLRSL